MVTSYPYLWLSRNGITPVHISVHSLSSHFSFFRCFVLFQLPLMPMNSVAPSREHMLRLLQGFSVQYQTEQKYFLSEVSWFLVPGSRQFRLLLTCSSRPTKRIRLSSTQQLGEGSLHFLTLMIDMPRVSFRREFWKCNRVLWRDNVRR